MVLDKDEVAQQEIMLQAQKFFQQYGLKKTTMDEIATACGKSKSTIYQYFASKDDLFDAVIYMELVSLRKHVKDRVASGKNMQDKLTIYLVEFYQEVIHRTNLYRILIQENMAETLAKKYFFKMVNFEKSYIIRIIEDGHDSGECSGVDQNDISWIAETLLAAFYGVIQLVVVSGGKFEDKRFARAVNLILTKIFS